jgi:hypothetical protein
MGHAPELPGVLRARVAAMVMHTDLMEAKLELSQIAPALVDCLMSED